MRLLVDGYNLLHVTDLFGTGKQAGTLQGSREALLAVLVARLPSKLRQATTVVFDAAQAPPGLPDEYDRDGLQVRFARGWADADALLEQIIELHTAPKSLLVVSADHRVQRAARKRGAKFIDSGDWFRELMRKKATPHVAGDAVASIALNADYWKREFAERVADDETLAAVPPPRKSPTKPAHEPTPAEAADEVPPPVAEPDHANPFPPGYASELADLWDDDL